MRPDIINAIGGCQDDQPDEILADVDGLPLFTDVLGREH
jgi:hypothetical protein